MVAVSGGPDSVALLSLFNGLRDEWRLKLHVVHFDHGLRGRESDADVLFVRTLCEGLAVPCIVKRLAMNGADRRSQGSSLQEYARNRRYHELASLAEELDADKIAVGHTADDQVETMIMWMVRGAGTKGLSGIPPVRPPHIIRPLLSTSRAELLEYLQVRKLSYRIDSSNDKPIYLRNRIRHEVMPILKQYNPNLIRAVARQADVVRAEDRYLDQLAREALVQVQQSKAKQRLTLHRTRLLNLPLAMQRRVLRMAIREVSGTLTMTGFDTIEAGLTHIVSAQSGLSVDVNGVSIVREYDQVHVCSFQGEWVTTRTSKPMDVPSQVVWPLTGQSMDVSTALSVTQEAVKQMNGSQVRFDADTCSSSLVLRNWSPGDHFFPLGMGGKRKKLQDFFSDIKLARSLRHTIPLLVAPEGIVWVGGHRLDHRFRVTTSTRHVFVANLSEVSESI